jgi:hypothetical protein
MALSAYLHSWFLWDNNCKYEWKMTYWNGPIPCRTLNKSQQRVTLGGTWRCTLVTHHRVHAATLHRREGFLDRWRAMNHRVWMNWSGRTYVVQPIACKSVPCPVKPLRCWQTAAVDHEKQSEQSTLDRLENCRQTDLSWEFFIAGLTSPLQRDIYSEIELIDPHWLQIKLFVYAWAGWTFA